LWGAARLGDEFNHADAGGQSEAAGKQTKNGLAVKCGDLFTDATESSGQKKMSRKKGSQKGKGEQGTSSRAHIPVIEVFR